MSYLYAVESNEANDYFNNQNFKTMLTSEIKSTKAVVAGKFSSVVKQENITNELHKLLASLGYSFTSQFAYKAVEQTNWSGIPNHARELIVSNAINNKTLDLIASEFNVIHLSIEQLKELVAVEKNVEKLTRLANIS